MVNQAPKLETQILVREQELADYYRKLLDNVDDAEKKTIIRDILLQRELNELLVQSMFAA